MIFLFFIFAFGCFAANPSTDQVSFETAEEISPTWKFRKFAALGYRRDRQSWNELSSVHQDGVVMRYRGRNTLAFTGGSHMEWLGLVLNFEGSYGWLLEGRADLLDRLNGYEFKNLKLRGGYTADARGLISVRIKLLQGEHMLLSFLPGGGIQYGHMQNTVQGGDREFAAGGSTFSIVEFATPNQQDWFGPIGRGSLECFLYEKTLITLFYQYEQPEVRSKSKVITEIYGFTGQTLNLCSQTTENSIFRGKHVRGQLGGVDLRYHDKSGWILGAHFEGKKSTSNTSQVRFNKTVESFLPAPRVTTVQHQVNVQGALKAVEYWVYLFAGYKF